MAALTWRNVEAPSFYTSLEGTRLAANLLDRAVGNLQTGLTNYERGQDDVVSNQLALAASRIQDPTQLRTALSDGTLVAGLDTSRISPQALAAIQQRVGTLQTQNEAAYNFNRTQTANAALDAAAPAVADLLRVARSGDANAVTQVQANNRDVLAALPVGVQRDLQSSVTNQESSTIRNTQDRFNLNRDQRNDTDAQTAAAAISLIRGASPDAASALRNLNLMNLTPGARALAEQSLGSQYPGMFGPLGSGGGVGGVPGGGVGGIPGSAASAIGGALGNAQTPAGGAAPNGLLVNRGGAAPGAAGFGTAAGSVYDVTYQNKATDRPITSMTLGELNTHQAGMIRTQGNSPVGAFQINKATLEDFGPRVLGQNWKSQTFTPEVQDRIGEAIFNSTNGDAKALKGRWDGLTMQQAESIAKLPWSQAKQVIAAAESGATGTAAGAQQPQLRNPAEVLARTVSQQLDTAQRNSQNTRIGLGQGLIANQGSTETAPEVARRLKDNFPGVDIGALQATIQNTAREANVNHAQAGHIVLNSLGTPANNAVARGFRSLTGNMWGNSVAIDEDLLRANVQAARSGKAIDEANVNTELNTAQATITQAQSQYVAARDALLRLQTAAVDNPAYAAEIPRYQARLVAAQTLLENAVNAASRAPQLQADRGQRGGNTAAAAVAAAAGATPQFNTVGPAVTPNDGPPALVPVTAADSARIQAEVAAQLAARARLANTQNGFPREYPAFGSR